MFSLRFPPPHRMITEGCSTLVTWSPGSSFLPSAFSCRAPCVILLCWHCPALALFLGTTLLLLRRIFSSSPLTFVFFFPASFSPAGVTVAYCAPLALERLRIQHLRPSLSRLLTYLRTTCQGHISHERLPVCLWGPDCGSPLPPSCLA